MTKPDFRGARGSNVGDDFHELWALRQALALLDPTEDLAAVIVEGLRAEDERGKPADTWDGVDCALYCGGDNADSAKRIVIAQLKYSGANPEKAWTVSRLTHASNKKKDNSVIHRLAKAFAGLGHKRPDLITGGNIAIRLVSNQPVEPTVSKALSDPNSSVYATLLGGSGLEKIDFENFANALDLSECGHRSRFALEESVLKTISEWTEGDARATVNDLLSFIRRKMGMPEAKGEEITRQSILARFGVFDLGALFPCPSAIKRQEHVIPREASRVVTIRMKSGDQRICLHGEGGCGKTTALQEIKDLLPAGSTMVTFDCYGNGRYLNSDGYRHRVPDALLQLSNELAAQLRLPLLLSPSSNIDYPKIFKKRLVRAAEVIASTNPDALLVVAIDAADNSVTAANTRPLSEKSFIHDFFALGDLPCNVRFVVTARTGQIPALNLPQNFTQIEIKGFERSETALSVRRAWKDAPDNWIEDFHHFSGGNPRVQEYALDYAKSQPTLALDYLRPTGKNLDQIFRAQLELARQKVGRDEDIKLFCAGLIALPRPIPLFDLAAVTELQAAHVQDLCADLAPGVRLANKLIGFSNEDFEQFVREEAQSQLAPVQARIADYFLARHKSDAYAAAHVAAALLTAKRGGEILDLIKTEREPIAIDDPVLRRQTQQERLRIAMRVCRDSGNNADALLTLLIGAEALKTEAAILRTLIDNPDLAATFAHDTSARLILRNAEEIENHGPLLFHLMAADSRDGNGISVREGNRQVRAWLQRRDEQFEEQKKQYPNSEPRTWRIEPTDVAAQTEAVLRIAGPRQAIENVLRWSPKSLGLRVAAILSSNLITSCESTLIERCLSEGGIRSPWDLFLLTPLALAGKDVELSRLDKSLGKLRRRGLIKIERLSGAWSEDKAIDEYFDTVLTACEIIVARGGDRTGVISVLDRFADEQLRRRDKLFTSRPTIIDFTLRAHVLLMCLAGRKSTLETYLVDPPSPHDKLPPKQVEQMKRSDDEKKEELSAFIGPFLPMYEVRAKTLLGSIPPETIGPELQAAIDHYHTHDYRIRRQYEAPPMRTRAGLSIARLMCVPGLDSAVLLEYATALIGPRSDPFGSSEAEIFESLALDPRLHNRILSAVTVRATSVRQLKISAQDKLAALIRLARLLLPISREDAAALFKQAIEVAGEIDEDAIHEISLFAPLAARAVSSMNLTERRDVARDFSIVVSDAAVRLEGDDHFPWTGVAEALATLDLPFALAAAGRWEDADIVGRASFLQTLIKTGLTRHELSPEQACALLPLVDEASVELIGCMLNRKAVATASVNLLFFSEGIAKDELLRFGHGTRAEIAEKLKSLSIATTRGFWLERLVEATNFHRTHTLKPAISTAMKVATGQTNEREKVQKDPFGAINWQSCRFVSVKEIDDAIDKARGAARAADTYLGVSEIFDRIRNVVTIPDRRAHLDALANFTPSKVSDYELADAITKAVVEWRGNLSIDAWCKERLGSVLENQLPGLSRYLPFDRRPLLDLLENSGLPDGQIANALIEGLERHVDELNAPAIYGLVGVVGKYCLPSEASQLIVRYANRLLQRIDLAERANWDVADIPTTVPESMSRYLYALMGDVDVRTRWRAAHAVRRLARLGSVDSLDKLIRLYERISDCSYRDPNAPFYWLSARLWLVISLDRVANETPFAIASHGQFLLDIATNDDFPHILLRSFAKSAVYKLVDAGALQLSSAQKKALKIANTSPVRRRKAEKPYYSVGFDRYHYKQRDERRFHFDTLDTLPYWYSGALRCFAAIDGEKFLDTAEQWIVDRWGVQNNPWQWDQEPRQKRLSDRAVSSSHSHGSLPILERFHTYLEWHAMWCATGELMQRHSLARVEKGDHNTIEHWLRSECLTAPPQWLADFRGPQPLELRFWFAPPDIDAWIEDVGDDDFLTELGLLKANELIVVEGHHETRSREFSISVQVRSALVSPETAMPLVRALQTVDDSWDYHIPLSGDDSEIDVSPYKLKGWIIDDRHDLGIDERDPFRCEVRGLEYCPSPETASQLSLKFICAGRPRWIDKRSKKTVFEYEAWSDTVDYEAENRLRYDGTVRSNVARLLCEKSVLRTLLNTINLDLIVEIEITRRNKGYGYSLRDEEKAKESKFDRVVLFRRDGTIETAEGCLGSWTAPRA